MGDSRTIQTGLGGKPVFVRSVIQDGYTPWVELRIGEATLAGKTRFVQLRVDEAEKIAEALQDAVREISDAQRQREPRTGLASKSVAESLAGKRKRSGLKRQHPHADRTTTREFFNCIGLRFGVILVAFRWRLFVKTKSCLLNQNGYDNINE